MRQWLGRLRRYRQVAARVALAVIWWPVLQVWWLAPQRAELAERRTALAQKQAEIARMEQAAARLPAAESEVAALQSHVDAARVALGAAGDAAYLLRRIERLASATGVRITGFTPQPALVHELHSEWPTGLELSGRYRDVLAFHAGLAGCAAELAVDDFTIRAVEAAEGDATVAVSSTLRAFGFNGAGDGLDGGGAHAGCEPSTGAGDGPADGAPPPADPFSRMSPPEAAPAAAARPPGLPGLRVGELTLQGLVRGAGRPLAVVAAPDGETHLLRGGERLLDGVVKAVHAGGVVFVEYVGGAARETRLALTNPADGR